MKKILYSLAAVATLMMATSCQDEKVVNVVENPVQTGDEITFGSSLPEDIQTKTIYGQPDAENQVFPVYWADGDEIAIYCPQASMPGTQLARYRISAPTTEPYSSTATAVTRIGDAGLQWGTEDLHKFYAFYPSSGVKGTESTGFFDFEIPVNQDVNRFYLDKDGNWQADIDMDLALMYAYRGQKKSNTPVGTNIDLHFKPLSTILEIVVQGPANANETLTLTNINVETTDGTPIVGQFHAQITPGSDTDEAYTEGSTVTFSSKDVDKVVNNLSIECSWKEGNETKFVQLGQGQKLYVKAFMLPTKNVDSKNIKITVSTTKGAVHKTLVNGNQSFIIAQNKVNRVTLPALITDFETAYWMNSLDPNIYLTELSIPGSKMTTESPVYGVSDADAFQTTSIEQQYKDGVRAFILQTYRNGDGSLTVARVNKPLTDVLGEISAYLKDSQSKGKNEFAFTLITYDTSGSGTQKQWMESLQTTINNMDADVVYKEEINPNTTLGDVFGKIVVKCNYNSADMINGVSTAPMLYTIWQKAYVEGGLPMPWNDPHASSQLTWLYQEVTSSTETSKNTCGSPHKYSAEDSKEKKITYIKTLFEKSLAAYKTGNHDTWFMNDLGGYYAWCTRDDWSHSNDVLNVVPHEVSKDIITLTKDLNQLGIDELQNREENAGLGLIFMNFANRGTTGQAYKSDLLLQTIIDNNFKFALRKKTTTPSPAPSYNASYSNGGNAIGWDK